MEWIYITLGFLGGIVFTAISFICLLARMAKQMGGK